MDKYRITEEWMEYNCYILWRIECLKTRKKGGWVQSEKNLSQLGTSWIADDAKVYGEAIISDHATVSENAEVFGAAKVMQDAAVYGNAIVADYAIISEKAQIFDHALVEDSAQIYGQATVSGHALVFAAAKVYEQASISGYAQVYDDAQVYGSACITDYAHVYKEAQVKGKTIVSDQDRISENLYNWEDINSLSELKIYTANTAQTATVYANGKHQIEVIICLEARDRDQQIIRIPPKEILDHIAFVNDKNHPLVYEIHMADRPGIYVYPQSVSPIGMSTTSSFAVCYLSIRQVVDVFRLSVRCNIKQWTSYQGMGRTKRVEYSTAIENNNTQMAASSLAVYVLPKREFIQSNIDVQTITEKEINGIVDSLLIQYYVQFNEKDELILRHASCVEKNWFHYRQKGIYKGCSTSTDQLFKEDLGAFFTAKFEFTSTKYKVITAQNHKMSGLCFWVFQLWGGLLWSLYEGGGEMYFSLYDQYGNEANVVVKSDEEEQLSFSIRKKEINRD